MENFKELLAACGVDWDAVSDRFCGDAAFYMKCVEMFAADDNYALLKKSLAARDLDTAFRAAHTIKGMAANMGFAGVCEAACAVVEPLRSRRTDVDYNALVAELGARMREVATLQEKAEADE